MKYWLMKSEPDVYSIDQLKKDSTTWWEGVRNYQARNFMQKDMQVGDMVLFYHSNAEPPGVAGLARISRVAEPDKAQFDKKSEYFDAKATKEKPIWYCTQVEYVQKFSEIVSLQDLRDNPKLSDMLVLAKGSRLSVQPVDKKHFDIVKKMGGI
ncbi:EVE domain-containing protein [Bdellovibrio sp. KM01]|uniref:EVE domain-containing protein n=1 Tax=Bdellovibrio sp. KM01 TaxID=2748865 RepID=UPI0015E964C9|nr:EVE domain-containing protein [Bdellovibrio sp. KM01]QLY26634.1 EVE domain-containing protein [Bdellovibrio sp. KM01]